MRLTVWVLFGACSAVLPLVLIGIVMFDHDKLVEISDTWSHGELLLIAMTLLMASLGDLIVYESVFPKIKALIIIISIFLIIVSAVWYSDSFSGMLTGGKPLKGAFLRKWSPWFFGFSLINASVCIMLPKREREV